MSDKLAQLVAEIMNVDPADINQRTPLRAADGLDALDFARLIIAAEKRFSLTIYDVDAAAFWYFEDMRAYLADRMRDDGNDDEEVEDAVIDVDEYFYSDPDVKME